MFYEDSISRIQGLCDCDGRKMDDENRSHKIKLMFSIFPWFSSPNFPHHNRRIRKLAISCLRTTFLRIYPSQSQDPRIRDIEFSSKLLMVRNWVTKITAEKIENVCSIFSVAICITQTPTHFSSLNRNHHKTLDGWQKSHWKNRKRLYDFFSYDFHPPPPPLQSSQDPRICDIESASNIFGNLLITISNLRVPRLRWEWARKGNKNRIQKYRKCQKGVEKNV